MKLYIYGALIAGLLFLGWQTRGWYEDSKDVKVIIKAEKKDEKQVKEVIKWRTKEKVVYRDKIKYIDKVQDPTGCADIKYTDMGFRLQSDH